MSIREFLPRGKRAARRPPTKAVSYRRCGAAGGVTVQYDPALGADGQQLAAAVLAAAAADYQRVAALFAGLSAPPVVISIDQLSQGSDGTGGAWHTSCADTTLHADASFGRPDRTAALWIAEFAEVLQAVQNGGWDCGNTNGEGLSRVVAEWAYPGAIDDYSAASVWLDGQRPNYVDQQQGSDQDGESNGVGPLFLWWLVSLGYTLEEIVGAPSSNLAGTYTALGGQGSAWSTFLAAVEEEWPSGPASGVTSDNPWTAAPPPPPPPPAGAQVTLSADVAAGGYALVPLAAFRSKLQHAHLTASELQTIVTDLLAILLGLLAAAPPMGGSSSAAGGGSPASSPATPAGRPPAAQR